MLKNQQTPGFSGLELSQDLIQVTQELGYETLTPVQAQSIPIILQGRDVICQSQTGSGKTAAFAVPLLNTINLHKKVVQALILAPTRELCTQVAREVRKLGRKHPGLQVLILCGGQPLAPQADLLAKGVHVVVGTPGRVLDHLNRKSLDLALIQTLILDEADRMLDMGFQEDMEKILKKTPPSRQTLLFSATYPKTIESLSRGYQRRPLRVTIESDAPKTHSIRQVYFVARPEAKTNGLLWVLQQNQPESAMIFCNQKATVIQLTQALGKSGISCGCLHGDLEQRERDQVMAQFRNRSIRMLVATDVAARGIDVQDLELVINFDLPQKAEIYTHRIGRTGRAGKKGSAISFVTSGERGKIQAIEKLSGVKIDEKILADVAALDPTHFKKNLNKAAAMVTLLVSGGRKDKLRPGDLLGALTGEAGAQGSQIGKIEIHDQLSYVAVAPEISQQVLRRLQDGKIKGRRFRVSLTR